MKIRISKGIIRRGNRILLLRKKRDFLKSNRGKWEIPGGKIRPKETPKSTMLREAKEETGLKFKTVRKLAVIKAEFNGNLSTCHLFELKSVMPRVKISDEHSAYRWVKPKNFSRYKLVKFAELIKPYLEKQKPKKSRH